VRALAERGDDVRVVYRNPNRLRALSGIRFRRAKSDVLDYKSMRRALRGIDVLFHGAGFVASSPVQRVWELNAEGPVITVEAAAAAGVRRVVLTSTISATGTANGNGPADESTSYPDNWLGLAYPDSKHAGERAAVARRPGRGGADPGGATPCITQQTAPRCRRRAHISMSTMLT
jgi:dihydroflavonol-4-reductase